MGIRTVPFKDDDSTLDGLVPSVVLVKLQIGKLCSSVAGGRSLIVLKILFKKTTYITPSTGN